MGNLEPLPQMLNAGVLAMSPRTILRNRGPPYMSLNGRKSLIIGTPIRYP